jgi:IS5 family transposase
LGEISKSIESTINIEDGIMHKASRNRGLTTEEKERNKAISKKRFVVKRCFGTLKRQFKFVTHLTHTLADVNQLCSHQREDLSSAM